MYDLGLVTPCRNIAETIDGTIWSVVSQEGGHRIRYHVQDAGSTDGTLDKLAMWKDRLERMVDAYPSHVDFTFTSEPDKGMYDGINKGFERLGVTDETYVGWLNADDILLPGAVNAVVGFGASQPGVHWITGRPAFMNQHGRIDGVSRSHFYPREILAAGLADGINWCFVPQENTFWRMGLFKRVGGLNARFRLAGDWDLWRRFAQVVPVVHLQRPLAAFRSRPGQFSMDPTNYWIEMEDTVSSTRRAARIRGLVPDEQKTFEFIFADQQPEGSWYAASMDMLAVHAPKPAAPERCAHFLTCTSKSRTIAPLFAEGFDPDAFTYSRISHMRQLIDGYLVGPYGSVDIWYCDLKAYQDALCTAFIDQVIPHGAKILEVGGGLSRVLHLFKSTHECWNIDKFEGIGNGLKVVPQTPYRLVTDYMGEFNPELPDNYFDFVFSLSTLEHLPEDENTFKNVLNDIQRVLKPGGWSLHLFDVLNKPKGSGWWTNGFVPYVFKSVPTLNREISPDEFEYQDDMFWLQKQLYEELWRRTTKDSYEVFGAPGSLQLFWKKPL